MEYIATFYSHFGAIKFNKKCESLTWPSRMMPVPRALSSSCGTCVKYTALADSWCPFDAAPDEVEQVVKITDSGYENIYAAKGS